MLITKILCETLDYRSLSLHFLFYSSTPVFCDWKRLYQMTPRGNSLIPITSEMTYVTSGLYQGRTAFSVGFWVLGTSILTILTTLSLIFWNWLSSQHIRIIILGMAGAGICYLLSCGFQYGLFLSGPAGTSLPIGVILMIIFSVFIYSYQYLFRSSVENSTQINNYEQ